MLNATRKKSIVTLLEEDFFFSQGIFSRPEMFYNRHPNKFILLTDIYGCGIMMRIVRTDSLSRFFSVHGVVAVMDVVLPTNRFE